MPFAKMKDLRLMWRLATLTDLLKWIRAICSALFSESFDIMREELKASGARELALQKKERELIASLSHDLKTPVTGIKLTSELMARYSLRTRGRK